MPAGGALTIGAGGSVVLAGGLIAASEVDAAGNGAVPSPALVSELLAARRKLACDMDTVVAETKSRMQSALPSFPVASPRQNTLVNRAEATLGTKPNRITGRTSIQAKAHDTVLQAAAREHSPDDLSWPWIAQQLNQRAAVKKHPVCGPVVDEALARLWE